MVDLRILESRGISAEAWEKKFKPDMQPADPSLNNTEMPSADADKVKKFRERMRSRINAGIDYGITNYRLLHAVDLIWSTSARQVSPTLMATLISQMKGESTENVLSVLKSYGYDTDLLTPAEAVTAITPGTIDGKSNKPVQTINLPALYSIMVPFVRSMLTVRQAKLVNDRNRRPLIPFEPAVQTKENRARIEVLNSRVQTMADQYDYLGTLNQGILQMLLYPTGGMAFTLEAWHREEQERVKGEKTKDNGDKTYETEKFTVREGLRYILPHPSRIVIDQAFAPRTLNSDTGCTYVGFWRVLRFGELQTTEGFYNTDKISFGTNLNWWTMSSSFFRSVYSSCTINAPCINGEPPEGADREKWLSDNSYYSSDMTDKSVIVMEYREKLVPSEWGLGDYDHPIWARFVVAGDGTVVYAEPLGYRPAVSFKDNGDEKLREDTSLALTLTPFQDQITNFTTQLVLTAKQSLDNLTMVDKNVLDDDTIEKLKNLGENSYRKRNVVGIDSKQLAMMFRGAAINPIFSHRFPNTDIQPILAGIKIMVDLAERMLQFSAQESAQAASHEQTAKEMDVIHASSSNILQFTGLPVDNAIAAMWHQIYEATINHGDDEFYAQIPSDTGISLESLEEMGITQDDRPGHKDITHDKKMSVKVKKTAISLITFAVVQSSDRRTSDFQMAQAMATFMRDLLGNAITAQALGPDQAMAMANAIAKLANLPLDEKLKNVMPGQEQEILGQVVQQVLQQVKQGMMPVLEKVKYLDQAVQAISQALNIPNGSTQTGNANGQPPRGGGDAEMVSSPGGPVVQAPPQIPANSFPV